MTPRPSTRWPRLLATRDLGEVPQRVSKRLEQNRVLVYSSNIGDREYSAGKESGLINAPAATSADARLLRSLLPR